LSAALALAGWMVRKWLYDKGWAAWFALIEAAKAASSAVGSTAEVLSEPGLTTAVCIVWALAWPAGWFKNQ
jgi:hypothetical protein